MSELSKTFEPKAIEDRWYAHWESKGLFRPDRGDAQPWTIVMPPPNVTGSLHIGHALDITLQDVLTRRERMLGKDALWVVGTDHAGIATQMVVERNLESQGVKRAEIGTKDVQGKFYTLSYPLADGSGAIQVATTRPETMLADMAVAVHPDDKRYRGLIGKQLKHPITGRLIPIIADEHADPELGSGAVKITPGHGFNDFEVGKRAGFAARDMLNMFDGTAHVVQTQDGLIPQDLLGLTREEARKSVVARLEDEGALVRVEDRVIPTPSGDRSGVTIEPWLTDQWYVDAAKLALPALQAVKNG